MGVIFRQEHLPKCPSHFCNQIDMKLRTARFAHLLRLLRHKGRSREDAEDLIQDALLRLTEYCRTCTVHNEAAFLERTVINLSIDRFRRESRHPAIGRSVEDIAEAIPLVDPAPDPVEVLGAQERLERIRLALDSVNVRTRQIYFAHRAGYSHRELANAYGISISSVEKAIARAVVALMDIRDPQ